MSSSERAGPLGCGDVTRESACRVRFFRSSAGKAGAGEQAMSWARRLLLPDPAIRDAAVSLADNRGPNRDGPPRLKVRAARAAMERVLGTSGPLPSCGTISPVWRCMTHATSGRSHLGVTLTEMLVGQKLHEAPRRTASRRPVHCNDSLSVDALHVASWRFEHSKIARPEWPTHPELTE